jgi:hypothetical protein
MGLVLGWGWGWVMVQVTDFLVCSVVGLGMDLVTAVRPGWSGLLLQLCCCWLRVLAALGRPLFWLVHGLREVCWVD